jgi:hypothetical protein
MSAILTQSLRGRMSSHMRYPSNIMFAPRLEYAFFQISTPVFMEYDYRAFRFAGSVRLGPVFFGTNSIKSVINAGTINEIDVFAGISFGNLQGSFNRRIARLFKKKGARYHCMQF